MKLWVLPVAGDGQHGSKLDLCLERTQRAADSFKKSLIDFFIWRSLKIELISEEEGSVEA